MSNRFAERDSAKGRVKSVGQYFTPRPLAEFMVGLIGKSKDASVLDPCAGQGVFLEALQNAGFRRISGYELDSSLVQHEKTIVGDFLTTSGSDGFDVIIGNPPYVRWKNISPEYRQFLKQHPIWRDRINGLGDLSHLFIMHSVERLNPGGELIFITPVFWTETTHSGPVRRFMADRGEMELMILLGEARLFPSVASAFLIFKFVKAKSDRQIKVVDASTPPFNLDRLQELTRVVSEFRRADVSVSVPSIQVYEHPQFRATELWIPSRPEVRLRLTRMEAVCSRNSPTVTVKVGGRSINASLAELFTEDEIRALGIALETCQAVKWGGRRRYLLPNRGRLLSEKGIEPRATCVRLGAIADIGNGLVSGCDRAFRVGEDEDIPEAEQSALVHVVKARCLHRLFHDVPERYIFVNFVEDEDTLAEKYPTIMRHLSPYREVLERRYQYGRRIPWWHWVFLRNFKMIRGSEWKIVTPCKERVNHRGYVRFALAGRGLLVTQDVTAIVPRPFVREDIRYLLAVLSSNQTYDWLVHRGLGRGGVQELSEEPLARIPVRLINWQNEDEVRMHNEIVELVEDVIKRRREDSMLDEIQTRLDCLYSV